MGFPSRLAVAAWAAGLTTTALALSLGGCAREPGDPLPDTRVPVNASDLASPRCVDRCEPDYGSAPVNCAAAEAGLEFFPAPVWDFEGPVTARTCAAEPGEAPATFMRATALNLYSYTDNTTENLVTDDCACESADCDFNRFQPSTEDIERCGAVTHALHVRGGPFREWGGGVGARLLNLASTAATNIGAFCPTPPPAEPDPATPSFCPKPNPALDAAPGVTMPDGTVTTPIPASNYYAMVVDLHEWEGISFWARRGPDSQAGFRVALGDRNTDDDIAFLESNSGVAPRCSRIKQCECRQKDQLCLPRNPLSDDNRDATWCWNPATDVPPLPEVLPAGYDPARDGPFLPNYNLDDHNFERCGAWSCDQPYKAFENFPDLAFATQANTSVKGSNVCANYAFNTDQTGMYCYDPVHGPPPAEGTERCGDTWLDPVTLSPDWKFFKVPFAELRQEGWAKRFPKLDVSAVTMVRFTWSVGWVDYWIDDVRFYRRKK